MTMNRFQHANATSIEEVVEVLGESCLPLAGGTDLIAMMKEGLVSPERLVNLKTIPGLDAVAARDDGWHLGALMSLSALAADPQVAGQPGLAALVHATREAASPQLRHMATLGGNLLQRPRCWYFRNRQVPCWRKGGRRCFAFQGENKYHTILGPGPCYAVHPSDPAVALLALDASVLLIGPRDRRTLPLEAFYTAPQRDLQRADGYHPVTVLEPDELLAEVIVPRPADGAESTYVKVTERGAWDFALVSVAVSLVRSGGTVESARIALGGVATVPWRARDAEQRLVGRALSEDALDEAAEAAAEAALAGARPLEHNGYKLDLVKNTLRRAVHTLA